MTTTIRTFVAFDVSEPIKNHAARIQSELRSRGLHIRWVKSHSLHLTLKFIGDIPVENTDKIVSALGGAVAGAEALHLQVHSLGVFPGVRKPRVIWMGLGGETGNLKILHAKIDTALEALGFDREKKGFKAHLTLGRFKKGAGPELTRIIAELGAYDPIPFLADRLVFFKSDLKPQGAVHTPLAEFRLTET